MGSYETKPVLKKDYRPKKPTVIRFSEETSEKLRSGLAKSTREATEEIYKNTLRFPYLMNLRITP